MRPLLVLLMALTMISCAGSEPSDTGYVVLDPAARAAGLLVDTGDGAGPRSSSLPIPVSASEGATLIGDDLRAPLVVAPGETVEVTDARGTLVRGAARSDRLVVSGDRAQTEVLAQMLGAEVVTRDDGRLELVGDNVLFAAALYGDVAGIDAVSVLLAGAARRSEAAWVLGAPEEAPQMAVSEARIGVPLDTTHTPALPSDAHLDPASVVGLYETGSASLLIDAAGGYLLTSGGVEVRGHWSVAGGRLVLVAKGQSASVTMAVTEDVAEIHDEASGLVLRPARSYECRIPRRQVSE